MKKSNYSVLGVMSGTSLDGMDIAWCSFQIHENDTWDFDIKIAETIPYLDSWKNMLKEAIHFSQGRLKTLNEAYTNYLAEIISEFIDKHNIKGLDAVCSHGHTILHQPEKGLTLQIGNLPFLAQKIGVMVVCDFRVQDVQLGGQGAPLVPIGDRLLFKDYDYCLNLGGFANVSYEDNSNRIAFDICPVNIVLNYYAEKLEVPYDDCGSIAKLGTLNEELLNQLNDLSFYKDAPPKSLGLEWVQEEVFPLLKSSNELSENVLRTFVEHITIQLSNQFKEHRSILITGGGAYNSFLIERLKAQKSLKVIIPNRQLIEFKEALIFGLLGVLKLRGEINCLASVTGASTNHSSGNIFNP